MMGGAPQSPACFRRSVAPLGTAHDRAETGICDRPRRRPARAACAGVEGRSAAARGRCLSCTRMGSYRFAPPPPRRLISHGHVAAAGVGLPLVDGGVADPEFALDLRHPDPELMLLQVWMIGSPEKAAALHVLALSSGQSQLQAGLRPRGNISDVNTSSNLFH